MPSHWTIPVEEAGIRLDKFLAHRDRLVRGGRDPRRLPQRGACLERPEPEGPRGTPRVASRLRPHPRVLRIVRFDRR